MGQTAGRVSVTNIKINLPKEWCDLIDEYTVVRQELSGVYYNARYFSVSICKGMVILLFVAKVNFTKNPPKEEITLEKVFSYNHYIQNGIELHGETTITPEQVLSVVEALDETE